MKLAILKGFQEKDIVISCVPYVIGRCRSADLIIAHVNVSRNHCKVVKENELWKIYDFSSSGTYVNETLVGRGKSAILNNGDCIRFGPFESKLCCTFYRFDAASENSGVSVVTSEAQTLSDRDEKHYSKARHCCSGGSNVSVTVKENKLLEENKEILDLKFKRVNENLLGRKQEKETNIGQIINEPHLVEECSHSVKEKNVTERSESVRLEELTKEVQEVRKALSNLEERNCVYEELTRETKSKALSSAGTDLLENLADLMEAEFQCTICSELFVTAITLSCTHTFCKYCINQWKKKQKTCPVCRKKITNETRSLIIDNYIDKMVGNLSSELKERREAIVKERSEIGPFRKRSRLKK